MKANKCPSCGAPIEPTSLQCEYCGSYLIPEKDEENYTKNIFSSILESQEEKNVICVCGRSLEKGEYPIRTGKANLYRGVTNAAGGHLILTNRRFLFIDHGCNMHLAVKSEEESIYFNEVAEIEYKSVLFISKRIVVKKKDGTHQEYVVWNLDKWKGALKSSLPDV